MPSTVSRGVRAPIIRPGDDIVSIVVDSVLRSSKEEGFALNDRDIVCVTESIVARADNNYCTVDDIAKDVQEKFPNGTVGLIFPILSRNRFAVCLKGIARGAKRVILQLSYPADEVGNHLVDWDTLEDSGVNPYSDVLDLPTFRRLFGHPLHPFTKMDYLEYYRSIIEEEGAQAHILLANRPQAILSFTSHVIACDIHTRQRTVRSLKKHGADVVCTLADLMNAPVNGSGYCPEYGLLGSNRAGEDSIKLFPKNAQSIAEAISSELYRRTGKRMEAMVYGDGAFKDPIGNIWELADPVVSPGHTKGLDGLPNEIKLKYLADNDLKDLSGEALEEAMREAIRNKQQTNTTANMASMGTTPRRLTDLIGSLCDLTSGSGDKGTPIILVQGYFSNFAD